MAIKTDKIQVSVNLKNGKTMTDYLNTREEVNKAIKALLKRPIVESVSAYDQFLGENKLFKVNKKGKIVSFQENWHPNQNSERYIVVIESENGETQKQMFDTYLSAATVAQDAANNKTVERVFIDEAITGSRRVIKNSNSDRFTRDGFRVMVEYDDGQRQENVYGTFNEAKDIAFSMRGRDEINKIIMYDDSRGKKYIVEGAKKFVVNVRYGNNLSESIPFNYLKEAKEYADKAFENENVIDVEVIDHKRNK